jgi:hypothetical protein
MQALLLAPAAAAATGTPAKVRASIRTSAHVVIAGSGLGGIAVAARLGKLLDGVKITIVDAKEEHNYQPGYTLVATGVWPMAKVRERNADLQPGRVEWVKEMVATFEPESNSLTTASGKRIADLASRERPGREDICVTDGVSRPCISGSKDTVRQGSSATRGNDITHKTSRLDA